MLQTQIFTQKYRSCLRLYSEFLRKKLVAGGSAPYTFNDLVKFHRILIFISKVLILCPGRVLPDPASRINARWTNEELLLAVQV